MQFKFILQTGMAIKIKSIDTSLLANPQFTLQVLNLLHIDAYQVRIPDEVITDLYHPILSYFVYLLVRQREKFQKS